MRAYLRLDPNLADRKREYPDGAFRAFIECLTFAEQQPQRGRFRSEKLLRVLLDKRARWVSYLVQHGDLVFQPDGRLYLDGWDEWQEGDWKVHERVQRIRNKNRKPVTPPTVTDDTAASVNTPLSGGVSGKPLPAEAVGGSPYHGEAPTLSEEERDRLLQENLRLMNDPKIPGAVRRAAEHTVALLSEGRKSA